MLTKTHQAARHVLCSHDRPVYRQHMCGLCHALGDQYGLSARLLTNHDTILLNLLTSAQRPDEPETVMRRCPLNPARRVATNQDSSSDYAAAVAVELVATGLDDHAQDSGGWDLPARLGRRWLNGRRRNARHNLETFDLDTSSLTQLHARQIEAETDSSQDPTAPSAAASAAIFARTARLANNPQNEEALAVIGAQYGQYLYLADAYRDFGQDMARDDFNPLRRFQVQKGDTVALSRAGLTWLLNQFKDMANTIRAHTAELTLYRYRTTVNHLLTRPVDALIRELESRLDQEATPTFRQWTWKDALKAALFVMPAPIADTGITRLYMDDNPFYEDGEIPEKPKRGVKRKRDELPPLEEEVDVPKRKRRRQRVQQPTDTRDGWSDACLYASYTDCSGCDADWCDCDDGPCDGGPCDCNDGPCDCDDTECGGMDCKDFDCGDADCGDLDCD